MNFRSNTLFENKLPTLQKLAELAQTTPESLVIIYDKRLLREPSGAKWIKQFGKTYAVKGGEELKSIDEFPKHLKRIVGILGDDSARAKICLVSVGGGSVGDFVGFMASVLKRGVGLIHIPTTFLAAIDSAHGGKTALNVKGIKNQIGTFYPASAVIIVQETLQTLSAKHIKSGLGELIKMALLAGGKFFLELSKAEDAGFALLWKFIPEAIEAKNHVVEQDPYEKIGGRKLLNLGHTLGHCLEAAYGIEHGEAVALGLVFSLQWSHHRGHLSQEQLDLCLHFIQKRALVPTAAEFLKRRRILSRNGLRKLVVFDKKLMDRDHISFVFLEKIGNAFSKTVSLDSFLTEAERQGWVRP